MPRIDDYINARELARNELSRIPFEVILTRSGFESPAENTFQIPFLDRTYLVSHPLFEFNDQSEGDKEVPLQEQVLILHYMMAPAMQSPTNLWIAYREIPGAAFYFGVFVKQIMAVLY